MNKSRSSPYTHGAYSLVAEADIIQRMIQADIKVQMLRVINGPMMSTYRGKPSSHGERRFLRKWVKS